jgi:hypothetical protein
MGAFAMNIYWIPMVAIIGGISMVVLIVQAGAATRQRQAQLRADVQMKLIDRFGSANEFVSFVKSEEGREFLGDAPRVAKRGFIGGIRWGIVMACLGVAFLFCAWVDHDADFFIPAFILIGLGGGYFASAIISMRLAREMEKNENA